jgi:hypothetical protein
MPPARRPGGESLLPARTLMTCCSPRWSFAGCAFNDLTCEFRNNTRLDGYDLPMAPTRCC